MRQIKKEKHNTGSKGKLTKLSRKRLLPEEIEHYRRIGEVDTSQNWLEIFDQTIISDLFTIMNTGSDNQEKMRWIDKELGYYGFQAVGLGTNIYAMSNPSYPGVVFKIALDDNGIADNFNDEILEKLVNDYLGEDRYCHVYARHPSGIVSVQERGVPIRSQDRMDQFRHSIFKAIEKLSKKFLIIDLSPNEYRLNYVIARDGNWKFADASDLYPLANFKEDICCRRYNFKSARGDKKPKICHGELEYTDDYTEIVCRKCGHRYMPAEVRPVEKENMMSTMITDGTTAEEREGYRLEELNAMKRSGIGAAVVMQTAQRSDVAESIFEHNGIDPEDEEEDDDDNEEVGYVEEVEEKPAARRGGPKIVSALPTLDHPEEVKVPNQQKPTYHEPERETLQQYTESFEGRKEEDVDAVRKGLEKIAMANSMADSKESDAIYRGAMESLSKAGYDPDDDDDEDDEIPDEEDSDVSVAIVPESGVHIKFRSREDYEQVLEENSMPIRVSFDDGTTWYTAVSSQGVANILNQAFQAVIKEIIETENLMTRKQE